MLLLLADNLAAHQLGGFKVGVSFALCKCHDCLATASGIMYSVFSTCQVFDIC